MTFLHDLTMFLFITLSSIIIYKELFPKKEAKEFGLPKMKNIPEPPKENHVIDYDYEVEKFNVILRELKTLQLERELRMGEVELKLKCYKEASKNNSIQEDTIKDAENIYNWLVKK